ncbi:MAG TPA: Crp/Fnr family transcriptional regulator [Rhizomicrobium sp.]|nr:Crp/Fnr family transcriptional regulator [Rhizomicrobium sp.]
MNLESPSAVATSAPPRTQAERPTLSPLLRKLEALEPLSDEAKTRLPRLPIRLVHAAPREALVRESEPRAEISILLEGVAVRFKNVQGRRAILGFLLPGDVDEADGFVEALDHGIAAVTACKLALIPRAAFDRLLTDVPDLARGLRRLARREEAIRRVWLTNMGQRAAGKQAAHLFCEMRVRFEAAGMGGPDWFTNPFTQEDMSDVLGISAVHMNRVMQQLKDLELIRADRHVVRFPSPAKLQDYAAFDGSYLKSAARMPEPQ